MSQTHTHHMGFPYGAWWSDSHCIPDVVATTIPDVVWAIQINKRNHKNNIFSIFINSQVLSFKIEKCLKVNEIGKIESKTRTLSIN